MYCFTDVISTKETSQGGYDTPELELLIAILDRAVLDYCGREGELHEKAKSWLFSEGNLEDPFSFKSICSHLRLDPSAVIKRVENLNIPKNVSQSHRWLRTKVQKTRRKRVMS